MPQGANQSFKCKDTLGHNTKGVFTPIVEEEGGTQTIEWLRNDTSSQLSGELKPQLIDHHAHPT
jgi:hypothetical protein